MAYSSSIDADNPLNLVHVVPPVGISERLRDELHRLRSVEGFLAAAVTRRDGLVIQHSFRNAREAANLCAMAAAVVGASRATGKELSQGEFEHGLISYRDGTLLVTEAGPEAILACLLRPDANVGLAILEASRTSARVDDALASFR